MDVTCASLRLSGNFPLFIIVFAMSRIGAVRDLLPAIIILAGIRSTPVDFFWNLVFNTFRYVFIGNWLKFISKVIYVH